MEQVAGNKSLLQLQVEVVWHYPLRSAFHPAILQQVDGVGK